MTPGLVSILIPTWNKKDLVKNCIDSILAHTSIVKTPFEIIVVSNGCTDGTVEYLKDQESKGVLKAIYNETNKGFPKAVNQAAELAQGEFLCLLNNDCLVSGEWLQALLRCLRSDSSLAAVGPYTNNAAGYQKIVQGPGNHQELEAFCQKFTAPEEYVDLLIFFCALIRKTVWDKIGGLSNAYGQGCFEDNEFCFRALEAGHKLKTASCYVHHFGSKSFELNNPQKKEEYFHNLARNQRIFLSRIGKYKKVSLAMICADYEKPETLDKCLGAVSLYFDEINIVFNHKRIPKLLNYQKLKSIGEKYGAKSTYKPWTNFSEMRNQSLDMCIGDYVFWLDVDDILNDPVTVRDFIFRFPDKDVFKCRIVSHNAGGRGADLITHNRLFKNNPKFRFRNSVHEDVSFSMLEEKATFHMTNITVEHFGYLDEKTHAAKNLRNYKMLLKEIEEGKAHSLTYFGIVNCLMIFDKPEHREEAIQYIDRCFEECELKPEDPLYAKLWVLRGLCAINNGQTQAGITNFQMALKANKNHPEAKINLATCYIQKDDLDGAITELESLKALKAMHVGNMPVNMKDIETLMLHKLGDCYFKKAQAEAAKNGTGDKEKLAHYLKSAEDNYFDLLVHVDPNILEAGDRLCQIYRMTGRIQKADIVTVALVNKFPKYFSGWFNLAQTELQAQRYETAKVFLKKSVESNPKYMPAVHNLQMLEKMARAA